MPTDIDDIVDHLFVPLAVTAGADHVVVRLNPAGRALGTVVVGRPIAETLTQPELLTALNEAAGCGESITVQLSNPLAWVTCVPVDGGMLLHLAPASRPGAAQGRQQGTALQQLAGELLSADTPAAIGRLAVTTAAELLGADAASAYQRTDADTLTVLHSAGWPPETVRRFRQLELRRGRPLSDAVLDGVAVWLEDAEQWRLRYPEMAPVGTAQGSQATACLPLRVEDRDLGAVTFSFSRPRAFDPDERAFLQAVAAMCAQAMDRARLLEAERSARAAAERQRDHMRFLANTARLMEAPLSVEQRLQRLADLVVPELADWCAVHLVRARKVEQIAVAHQDRQKVEFVLQLQQRYPPDPDLPGGAVEVTRTGEPAFLPDVPDELLAAAAQDAEHLRLIREIGIRSSLVVPLTVRGRNLGTLSLVHAESGRRFDERDLAFARQVAATAAVALDNARLYEQQHHTAQTLQAALLPSQLPTVPGLRLAARYRTQADEGSDIQVGGDLYDVIAGPAPGLWAFVVADVCGKGAEAAAKTALIRHTIRAEVGHDLSPAEVLIQLNHAMIAETSGAPMRFATVVHGQLTLTPDGATVQLASGGHPPPLVIRGGRIETVRAEGTLIGIYPTIAPDQVTVHLARGDMMVLYTDGVTEARGVDGFYGGERLATTLSSAASGGADQVAAALLDDVASFQQGRLRDDVAILVLQVTAP